MSCGCGGTNGSDGQCLCDERTPQTPLPIANRPGLPRISRRIATQATAKGTMLRALTNPDLPATSRFTARTDDDFGVAIIDAAATVADIVTFYTERFANEHYLRTAQERRSLIELSRLIGYQPAPGLAATADLCFTMDTSPGAPTASVIPAGTGVQSSPDPGQSPVIYETLADIAASPLWNALRPRRTVPHPIPTTIDTTGMTLAFAGTVSVSVGDAVLFPGQATGGSFQPLFGLIGSVAAVDAVPDQPGKPGRPARTEVIVIPFTSTNKGPAGLKLDAPSLPKPATVPSSVSWLAGSRISAADLDAALLAGRMAIADVAGPFATALPVSATAVVFSQQRALFGSQAPPASTIAASVAQEIANSQVPAAVQTWAASLSLPWEYAAADAFAGSQGYLYLDGAAPAVASSGLIVLRAGNLWGVYQVHQAESVGVAMFGISGRAWRVSVHATVGLGQFPIRTTVAFTGGRVLPLADVPAAEDVPIDCIELDGLMLGLREGRPVLLTGEPVDDRGHPISISTTLDTVVHDFGVAHSTTVTLATQPTTALARSTVTIAANVAPASQGETRTEILGSGDGRQAFQTFALRQPPLTYLSSVSAAGLTSTLTIWVDGVRWTQVDSFPGYGAADRVYVVRNADGQNLVQFGDGLTGARLPTGTANIKAVYRSGSGLAGQVRAGQLTLPVSRSGGVTAVTNPAASLPGDDPETVDSARVSAPLRVTTLDRVVSLADYALYARAFPGVAKAQAVWARAGGHRGVLITVAGAGGAILNSAEGVGKNLLGALRTYGDPLVPVALIPHTPKSFRFTANVLVDAARVRADVLAEATARLAATFAFTARDLGQQVAGSEILEVVQGVPGVVAATITGLWMFDPASPTSAPSGVSDPLPAASPLPGADIGTLEGAVLIVLDSSPIGWGELP